MHFKKICVIEHKLCLLNYSQAVCEKVYGEQDHILAPATLNIGGGQARRVEGGYRLTGQWEWGTGILHSSWVLAGGLVMDEAKGPMPMFFLMPI